MSTTPRPTWYAGEYGCRQDMYAASVALPIFSQHDALVVKLAAHESAIEAVRELHRSCAEDDAEAVDTFGQHHPVAWFVADQLGTILTPLDAALGDQS